MMTPCGVKDSEKNNYDFKIIQHYEMQGVGALVCLLWSDVGGLVQQQSCYHGSWCQ